MTRQKAEWTTLRLDDASPRPDLTWALGQRLTVPHSLLAGGVLSPGGDGGFRIARAGLSDPQWAAALRLRAAFTEARPLSSRLPFSYQRVAPRLRSFIASCMGRLSGTAKGGYLSDAGGFPAFPLDLSSDFLSDLAGDKSPFLGQPTPLILSHDLDSHEGLFNFLEFFAPLEEGVGAFSVNYVPSRAWPLDYKRLAEVRARGHEIGVHGFDHSNRTAYLPQAKREQRLDAADALRRDFDATGYRAPSLLRTKALLHSLSGRFLYDSSIPTSGGRFPVPDNGCATARPFLVEGIAELPLSMPRDGTLRFLGYKPEDILSLWLQCAERIAASCGVVVLLTHCESRFSGNPPMLDIYSRFLQATLASGKYVIVRPAAVLRRAGLIPADEQEQA